MNVRGASWRKLAYRGARYLPKSGVEYTPIFWGTLFAALLVEERERIRGSLRTLFGVRSRVVENLDIVRTFVNYAHCLTESLAYERPEALSAEPLVHGDDHLRAALSLGRGVVIVTAHTGAWDAAARWLVRDYGAEVMLVMTAEEDDTARAFQDELRGRIGVRVAHVGGHPLDALPILKHLRSGGIVAMQLDRVVTMETALEVDLFDRPFLIPAGPFHLARLGNAPIVPVFTRRLGYFRYEVQILPPITVPSDGGPESIRRAASDTAREMGHFLQQNPTQWFHFVGAKPTERNSAPK